MKGIEHNNAKVVDDNVTDMCPLNDMFEKKYKKKLFSDEQLSNEKIRIKQFFILFQYSLEVINVFFYLVNGKSLCGISNIQTLFSKYK